MTSSSDSRPGLLIVDDDELIISLLEEELDDEYDIVGVRQRGDVPQALRQLAQPPACALVDLGLPPHSDNPREGFALVRELSATVPSCAVIVVSGQNEQENGKVARMLGALDYVAKPCDAKTIRAALARARSTQAANQDDSGLIGHSTPIARLARQVRQFAPAPYPVLLEGESGTGKELAAQALHNESGRSGKFVAINCAAVPEQLFEATLFGARKGSYTGANADTPGHLAAAQEGTLFLDEISDLPMPMQPKLLRLLENSEYLRVGDAMPSIADVRVIAATNRPLRNAMRTGGFREDLYHRLSVLVITTPPLRELGDDRMELLEHFRSQAANSASSEPFTLDEKATDIWKKYHFPGNVRELRNIVARLQVTHPGMTVTAQIMQEQLLDDAPATFSRTLEDLLAADARNHARAALDATGNLAAAASRLGIHPDHLQELLDQHSAARD